MTAPRRNHRARLLPASVLDLKAAAVDKTAKLEGNGRVAKKTVKFQINKAVKHEGASVVTERMSCKIYFW